MKNIEAKNRSKENVILLKEHFKNEQQIATEGKGMPFSKTVLSNREIRPRNDAKLRK